MLLRKKIAKRVLKRLLKYINKRINAYNSILTDPNFRSTDEKFKVIAILQELEGIIDIYHKCAEEEEEKEERI